MDFKELAVKVAEVQLGSAKITDMKKDTYSLVIVDDETVNLVTAKKTKYPLGHRALAAMRIVTDADKCGLAKTTREARDDKENFTTLQQAITEEGVVIDEKTKFTVVGHLRIQDAEGQLIYRNECYRGHAEYLKASRKAFNMAKKTKDEKDTRNAAFTQASDDLRASGVKTGANAPKEVDESYLMMPVFIVTN